MSALGFVLLVLLSCIQHNQADPNDVHVQLMLNEGHGKETERDFSGDEKMRAKNRFGSSLQNRLGITGCVCNGQWDNGGRGGNCSAGGDGREWCYVNNGSCSDAQTIQDNIQNVPFFSYLPCKVSCGSRRVSHCRWCGGDCRWCWWRSRCIPKHQGHGCFAPTSTVETREGVKPLPELLIGDEIRTSKDNLNTTGFTEFLGWLDRQESSPVKMLQLLTADNTPAVTLTASHVVFTKDSTKYAGDLVAGDTLLHWDGVQMEELEIAEIKTRQESGFWAPLTRSGTLLVDGFLMSCYASYPHNVSDVAFAPIKAMSMTLLDNQESQHKDGERKVVSFMKSMVHLFGIRKGNEIPKNFPMNLGSFANCPK